MPLRPPQRKAGAAAAAAATGGADDAAGNDDQAGAKKKKGGSGGARTYYRVTCKDNGCGMPHDRIPDMLGRVLSGSKYGVRQSRCVRACVPVCSRVVWAMAPSFLHAFVRSFVHPPGLSHWLPCLALT